MELIAEIEVNPEKEITLSGITMPIYTMTEHGEPVTEDEQARRMVAGMVLRGDISDKQWDELLSIYPVWSEYSDGTALAVGLLLTHSGNLYKVIQAHNKQSDWSPNIVPALFVKLSPAGVIAEWVQPAGAHDAYNKGDKVTFNGVVYESTINANVWAPNVYGWITV